MNNSNNKTTWIIVGVVAFLCLAACGVGFLIFRQIGSQVAEGFKTDPAEVKAVSDKIANFDVPPGYSLQMSMSLFVYDMVAIAPDSPASSSMMIMLMQFNGGAGMSREEMQEQMRQAYQQQGGQPGMQMRVVETREETIRGEQVTVTVSEGSSEGFTYRQWMTVFTGNGGPTVLMIQGATADWDDEMIANFIHSIR